MSAARQGKRWTPEEHQTMLDACKRGDAIPTIANILQRTPLAIEWRLVDCVRKAMTDSGMALQKALKQFGIRAKDYETWCEHMAQSIDDRRKVSPFDTLADLLQAKLVLSTDLPISSILPADVVTQPRIAILPA